MHGFVANILETWASFYANQSGVRTIIGFLHVAGLLTGGGFALAADRMTLIARRQETSMRITQLQALKNTHRIVVVGLVVTFVSGLLLFGADTDTFLYSKIFWIKMTLMVLLMINGFMLMRAESSAERGEARGWARLTGTSVASIVLWFLTTLAGAALPNIS
jgi:hypothetical protein